jgi:hypothetical protein
LKIVLFLVELQTIHNGSVFLCRWPPWLFFKWYAYMRVFVVYRCNINLDLFSLPKRHKPSRIESIFVLQWVLYHQRLGHNLRSLFDRLKSNFLLLMFANCLYFLILPTQCFKTKLEFKINWFILSWFLSSSPCFCNRKADRHYRTVKKVPLLQL